MDFKEFTKEIVALADKAKELGFEFAAVTTNGKAEGEDDALIAVTLSDSDMNGLVLLGEGYLYKIKEVQNKLNIHKSALREGLIECNTSLFATAKATPQPTPTQSPPDNPPSPETESSSTREAAN